MAKNSFQRLDDEFENQRTNEQIQRVKADLDHSVSFIQMVGRIVEVYLPRVFDVFMLMSGGQSSTELEKDQKNEANVNKPPSTGGFSDFGNHSGPSSPEV